MKKRIPYGIGDFELIRSKNMYYVDKTRMIKDLELHQYLFFIRPRRFGKSLLISTLENYYDILRKDRYDDLFKGLWIHEHPTEERNSYLILRLDFSGIETSYGKEKLYESFTDKVKKQLITFLYRYEEYFKTSIVNEVKKESDPTQLMTSFVSIIKQNQKKPTS